MCSKQNGLERARAAEAGYIYGSRAKHRRLGLCTAGVCSFMEGKLDQSARDLTSTISIRPSELPAYFNRAVVYEKLGKMAEAMHDIDTVLRCCRFLRVP